MNRIQKKFSLCREENRSALIGFFTVGDPTLEDSFEILNAVCDHGIDLLELGIPFSDATADGPIIQRSSRRALLSGTTLSKIFDLAQRLREHHPDIPMILFSYYNPVFVYGPEQFVQDAIRREIDGILSVDLPWDYRNEIVRFVPEKADFDYITLIAPSTKEERMKKMLSDSSGFLYVQTRSGITGIGGEKDVSRYDHLKERSKLIRGTSDLPLCAGFGISRPDEVSDLSKFCDGIIIGSAFERIIEENRNDCRRIRSKLTEYLRSLRACLFR
ncbi:MAG: tryptophan synthase subunit alpha [Planctomycetia bacterium]|nr:tryptophan synthase subunit alpha [Planctomycetia bacterium]